MLRGKEKAREEDEGDEDQDDKEDDRVDVSASLPRTTTTTNDKHDDDDDDEVVRIESVAPSLARAAQEWCEDYFASKSFSLLNAVISFFSGAKRTGRRRWVCSLAALRRRQIRQ